jgi:hypothetical protein
MLELSNSERVKINNTAAYLTVISDDIWHKDDFTCTFIHCKSYYYHYHHHRRRLRRLSRIRPLGLFRFRI